MKECPKCEVCYEDEVNLCPVDQVATRMSSPGPQLMAKRYFLEKRIGRGAMGQVYIASDQNLGGSKKVAVKTVRQDLLNSENLQEGEAIARFEREARSAASISHPNIVDVTDFGETEEGVFYLIMEYVPGETLHKLLRREGTLPVNRAIKSGSCVGVSRIKLPFVSQRTALATLAKVVLFLAASSQEPKPSSGPDR